VRRELKEKWPAGHRRLINDLAARRQVPRLVQLSHAVVEAGVYDAPQGTALVLANFTYEPIPSLRVRLGVMKKIKSVRSSTHGKLEFSESTEISGAEKALYVSFELPLGLSDIVLLQ
jgi:hypothetical protein